MFYLGGVTGFAILALWIFCVVDVITTPELSCRNLPKMGWVLLVLLFPLVGSIAWLVAGRPQQAGRTYSAYERPSPRFPEYDRPGRFAAGDSASDEEFLRRCRERAEEQRRKGRESG
ncbi:PLDc N-terminal domain-containing protein [Actinokineospora sp. HUAS TT18]|uniref:PLDc N-terminal domain-containing protein n=1 Tax=Actinokineospora sp. HUAS TT18 TaxID=3447451 RepID=UPI003F524EC7